MNNLIFGNQPKPRKKPIQIDIYENYLEIYQYTEM